MTPEDNEDFDLSALLASAGGAPVEPAAEITEYMASLFQAYRGAVNAGFTEPQAYGIVQTMVAVAFGG